MLNEDTIEQAFIEHVVSQGYTYYETDITPYSDNPQHNSFESVVLK